MAQIWFSRGKSWGRQGPKDTAREILASLDREEVLALMENQPELAIGMSQYLCSRVRSLQDRMDAG